MRVNKDLGNQGSDIKKTNTVIVENGKISHLNIKAKIVFLMIFTKD